MKYDRNKTYLYLPYKRENIKGELTKYELMIEENELLGYINDLFKEDYGLSNQQFKSIINDGFLVFDDVEKLIDTYHEHLLEIYADDIEEDYEEQLQEEKWYYGIENDDEEYYDPMVDRYEHGVSEHMFH